MTVDIFTARPGIVIGKSGVEVDALRKELHAITGKNVHININEIKRPGARREARRAVDRRAAAEPRQLPPRDEALARVGDALRRAGHQDPVRRPPRRRRDEPLGALHRGPHPAAHDPRRHRLRLRRGEDDLRPDRRQGLDQQGRDHARGLRGRHDRQGHAPRRPGSGSPPPRRCRGRARRLARERPRPRARTARASASSRSRAAPAAAPVAAPGGGQGGQAAVRPARQPARHRPAARAEPARRAAEPQDNVEKPRTTTRVSRRGREQPCVEPQVETTPPPVADAPDTTTPKTQTEDPTKLDDSGGEG